MRLINKGKTNKGELIQMTMEDKPDKYGREIHVGTYTVWVSMVNYVRGRHVKSWGAAVANGTKEEAEKVFNRRVAK